ncbi:MAG: tRNA dihydrouridine synthase DusB [Atopobiaceae bacterium]|nr:tRNA dihydrouridine synthase DusB [Atopobiaceae bacterium]
MPVTKQATPASILRVFAAQSGLSPELRPFAQKGDLAERLAANPFLMAPMAGVSDAAYRMMARAGGAALAYSEMVSVAGLHYGGSKTWELVVPHDPEPDFAVQLFGSEPEQFAEAVDLVQERLGERLSLIDINMACPVPKVTRKGEGSALLEDSPRAAAIVRACVAKASVPVTVKIRSARRTGEPEVAPEFARAMEQAGAAAIAVHGRTASQMYRGEADWGVVSRVVDAVTIPVIGSGDVRSPQAAADMLRQTGAAAVMVARGSYGNPWVFGDAARILEGQSVGDVPIERRIAAFCCHMRLLEATGAHLARARSLAGWYLKGVPHAAQWRDRAMQCSSVDEYLALADALKEAVE